MTTWDFFNSLSTLEPVTLKPFNPLTLSHLNNALPCQLFDSRLTVAKLGQDGLRLFPE